MRVGITIVGRQLLAISSLTYSAVALILVHLMRSKLISLAIRQRSSRQLIFSRTLKNMPFKNYMEPVIFVIRGLSL